MGHKGDVKKDQHEMDGKETSSLGEAYLSQFGNTLKTTPYTSRDI